MVATKDKQPLFLAIIQNDICPELLLFGPSILIGLPSEKGREIKKPLMCGCRCHARVEVFGDSVTT